MSKIETKDYESDEDLEKDAVNFRSDWLFDMHDFRGRHKTGLELELQCDEDGRYYVFNSKENHYPDNYHTNSSQFWKKKCL